MLYVHYLVRLGVSLSDALEVVEENAPHTPVLLPVVVECDPHTCARESRQHRQKRKTSKTPRQS